MTDRDKARAMREQRSPSGKRTTYTDIAAALGCSPATAHGLVNNDRPEPAKLPPVAQVRAWLPDEVAALLPPYRTPGRGNRSERSLIAEDALRRVADRLYPDTIEWADTKTDRRPGSVIRLSVSAELATKARGAVAKYSKVTGSISFPRVLGWAMEQVIGDEDCCWCGRKEGDSGPAPVRPPGYRPGERCPSCGYPMGGLKEAGEAKP